MHVHTYTHAHTLTHMRTPTPLPPLPPPTHTHNLTPLHRAQAPQKLQFEAMDIRQLRAELKQRGLGITGSRAVLVERLMAQLVIEEQVRVCVCMCVRVCVCMCVCICVCFCV